eukprot:194127-Rhodomonas_salina.1
MTTDNYSTLTTPPPSPPDNETITRTSSRTRQQDDTLPLVTWSDPTHQRALAPPHYYLVTTGLPPCRKGVHSWIR